MTDLSGIKLGQYEIIEKVGQGAMGHVFKAYQPALNRYVAIKVLSPVLAEEAGFTERFKREAQSVARLHHPNILQVYDFGVQDKYNYLVMRYVEGSKTLGDLISEGAPTDKLIHYIIEVADALNYAHEQGMVHRDVKPSNILIDGRWALLSDFGLVKIRETTDHQLTQTGMGMGTPTYMSPEQVGGIGVDHRSDIYALGIILHRILTGTIPHDAPTPLAIMVKRKTEPITPPRQINPHIAISLEHVILRTLAPSPDDRYSTATEFAEALKKAETDPNYREASIPTLYSTEDATVAATLSTPQLPSKVAAAAPPKRPTLWLGAAIAGVVIVIGALIFLLVTFTTSNSILANQPPSPTWTPEQVTEPAASAATDTPSPPTGTPVPPPPSSGVPIAIAQTELAVYSGPGESYDPVGYLPEGVKAEIIGRDKTGQWWQIKTSLTSSGVGWIQAGFDYVEAMATDDVPIALAPPTPTNTPTPAPDTATPTPTFIPDTPTPTASPTATTTETPVPPTATSTATATETPMPPAATSTATAAETRVPPTATSTATATQTRAIAPTATSTATAVQAQVIAPTATRAPAVPAGQFTLLKPDSLDQPSFGMTEFEWQWHGDLQPDQGFEVRVWREGEPPSGVHNAVEDNRNGNIAALSNNTYRLNANIRDAFGVKGRSGEYLWTVVLVQVNPEYRDLGIQAPPGRLRFEAGGGDGGGRGGGGGGGGRPSGGD